MIHKVLTLVMYVCMVDVAQRGLVMSYWRFATNSRSHFQGSNSSWGNVGIHVMKTNFDAIFILSSFRRSTPTCFRIYTHTQNNWYVFCFLVDSLLVKRHSTKITARTSYFYLYIYSIPPDDGLQICSKHVEVDRRNKWRINCASSWFLFHRIWLIL